VVAAVQPAKIGTTKPVNPPAGPAVTPTPGASTDRAACPRAPCSTARDQPCRAANTATTAAAPA
jgi:hypothetical protein